MNKRSVLVVVSHPDDEVLGCGGSIARHSEQGDHVAVLFMADGVASRSPEALDQAATGRRRAAEAACGLLGVTDLTFLPYPDNQLDQIPLLVLVQEIEKAISRLKPEIVYTHHSGDVNIDHSLTHDAVVTACRPQPGFPVRRLLFSEVVSSTEWRPPSSRPSFAPQWFNDISEFLPLKLKALEAYAEEMREYPHPRSMEAVEHLARWRGATIGVGAAEAFEQGREIA